MPWKDGYTISDERSIADHDIKWPSGMTCSFTVVVSLDPQCGPDGLTPADLKTPEAYYGMHGGLASLRAVLDKYRIRATFAASAALADSHPAVLRSLAADGHEIAAHGYLREDVSRLDLSVESERLQRTTACVGAATGQRPLGWYSLPRRSDHYAVGAISPATMPLLAECGYRYMGNSLADDVPHYWVYDPNGPKSILAMPYYYHFDDQFFLLFPTKGTGLEHADSLARNWRAEMDAQHRRGRSFSMVLHPYAIGWGHRLKLLDTFLSHATSLPGVWTATALQCAEHWLLQHPPESTLRLAPSIWMDHADSLS
jgi:peptidoglycan/xylan/chitin deacetylase (PgdA/CDA1 family)